MKLPDNTRGNLLKAKPCLSSRLYSYDLNYSRALCISDNTDWSHPHFLLPHPPLLPLCFAGWCKDMQNHSLIQCCGHKPEPTKCQGMRH